MLPEEAGTLSQVMYWEATANLTGDMLVKVDRMSMANSLEVAVSAAGSRAGRYWRRRFRMSGRSAAGGASEFCWMRWATRLSVGTAESAEVGVRGTAGGLVSRLAARVSVGHVTAAEFLDHRHGFTGIPACAARGNTIAAAG
jgi:hypothetical protein